MNLSQSNAVTFDNKSIGGAMVGGVQASPKFLVSFVTLQCEKDVVLWPFPFDNFYGLPALPCSHTVDTQKHTCTDVHRAQHIYKQPCLR